jgi:hypothetical protein
MFPLDEHGGLRRIVQDRAHCIRQELKRLNVSCRVELVTLTLRFDCRSVAVSNGNDPRLPKCRI